MIRTPETDELPDRPINRPSCGIPPCSCKVCLGKRRNKSLADKIIFFLPISWSRSTMLHISCVKKCNASELFKKGCCCVCHLLKKTDHKNGRKLLILWVGSFCEGIVESSLTPKYSSCGTRLLTVVRHRSAQNDIKRQGRLYLLEQVRNPLAIVFRLKRLNAFCPRQIHSVALGFSAWLTHAHPEYNGF